MAESCLKLESDDQFEEAQASSGYKANMSVSSALF